MKLFWTYLFFFFLCLPATLLSQTNNEINLSNQISALNDGFQYEKSIAILTQIISDENAADYDKYVAYLLKSHTYKRLFNYPKTLQALDDAYEIGIKTDKKDAVKNIILAEKSFVYFDTHDFKQAGELMNKLAAVNYKFIDEQDKSWLLMQEGYLLFLDKKYEDSEQKYDIAIMMLNKYAPYQLPNVYGKKIELYNEMKLFGKRDNSFKTGLLFAKKYKKIKYEMYLYEVLKKVLQDNKDYSNAFKAQQKFDSINEFYNTPENNGKVEIRDQNIKDEKQILILQNEKYQKYLLYSFIAFLIVILLFIVKLYLTSKKLRIFAERENERIYRDIERLTKELDNKGNSKLDESKYNLTERQIAIITFIRKGFSNREIANQLFVSENTIKYHLKTIYTILNIDNRTDIK